MVDFNANKAQSSDLAYQSPGVVNQRLRTLNAMAISAGDKVIDIGCGTGLSLREFAIAVGPNGIALGLDPSQDMLNIAADRCSDLSQVLVEQGTLETFDNSSSSFDAASLVQVLRYVKDVPSDLEHTHTLLIPGGRLAIIETDWNGTVLNSNFPEITQRILDAHDDDVPSANLPTKLIGLLKAAGFSAINVEAIPLLETSWSEGTFTYSMFIKFAELAVKLEAITELEAKSWLDDLDSKNDSGKYFFCVNRMLFSCVKL
jgi:ubiquinone/menaquinone biosynthesis C-methylase UbiE